MTDRPVLFSGPMVRALLDGTKSQTRRLAWRPDQKETAKLAAAGVDDTVCAPTIWQKVRPGDRLYVRETWVPTSMEFGVVFKADCRDRMGMFWDSIAEDPEDVTWRPSIHMPRWASRLTLVVTETKMERLQEITSAIAIAEGCPPHANSQTIDCDTPDPRDDFARLWNSLHGDGAWQANPEVVALTFLVHKTNIDQMEAP